MTSRERVLAALAHREPDRVPVDFGSTGVTGMHVSCVAALREHFQLPQQPVKVCEPYQMLGEIEERFGDKLVFWGGGVDTQHVLPFGTPAQVRRQVLERCEIFARNGGFVFNTIHNVQARTPVANIVALFDALREFHGIN